ncbi:MAG: hypothetical protein AAB225_17540 [Acidobacteriota bacterium]
MRRLLPLLFLWPLAAQQPAPVPKPAEAKPAQESPAPAAERWLTGNVDFGYRVVGAVGGDFNTYRSVVNLGEGPKLFGLDASMQDPSRRLFDRLDIRANSWGGDPYNTARLDVRRERAYDFSFDYRNIAHFDFLPSFADPTLQRGVFLNQRSIDTNRRSSDLELNLLPGRRIVPFVAFSRNAGRGRGVTVFGLEGNEYPVPNLFRDHSDDIRGGVRLDFNRFHFTLEQGRVSYHIDQQVYTGPGRNPGNVLTPVFGRNLYLDQGNQSLDVRGDVRFTRAVFAAAPFRWVDVAGQFLFSQPEADSKFSQNNTGNFFDFASRQFYSSQLAALTSQASQPHTSASFSAELRPVRRLRILESWMTDRLHNAGSAFLTDRLLVSGSPLDTRTLASVDRLVLNYNQQELAGLFDINGKATLRFGHRYVWGNASVPAAFVIERLGKESAELRRHVVLAGLSLRLGQRVSVNWDHEASPGDHSYFRTSLHKYQRAKIRARYQVHPSLAVAANFSLLDNENPSPGINYDFLSRQNTLSANWTPGGGKWFSILGEYTRFTLRSELTYLVPNTLDRELSFYREDGHSGTALVDVGLPGKGAVQPKLSFGGSLFASVGSRPARYYQPQARFSLPLSGRAQWYGEWRWYALSQPFYLFEGFRNHQFVIGFRLAL